MGELTTESSLTNYLTSTSATNIEQIEVITTPSSKYDASFSGSIVNLKTKKNYSNGYNGNLGFNSGIRSKYPNGRISGSINFKLNKLNGFLSNGYTVDNQISKGLIERIFANSYTPLIKEDNNGLYKPMNYYYTMGMDYSLNNNNSIGLLFNGSYNKTNNDLNNKSHIYGINNKIDSLNQMVSSSIRNSNFRTFDLYYKLKIDTSGQELNIDAALTFLKHTLKGNQKYSYFLPNMTEIKSPSLLIQQTHRNTLIKGFQADYIKPFRSIKFETGIKLSNSLTKQTFNQELNDISLVNNRNLDSINIQENIYALYSSINGKTLSWTYIVGIRGELTEFEIVANNKDANMYKKYFNIFPTILLAKKSNKNDMSISYKRTVVRPRYSQLNYFKYYNSPFYYFMGNPYLQAYYPNTFRFSWIYNKKIQLSVSQTFAKDKIIEYAERDTLNNLTRGLIGNNSSSRSLYISPSYFGNVTNWWYTNSGIGMNLMNLHFSSENIPITKKAVSFDFYSSNTFTITKKIRVESYCYLSSPVYYNAAKTGSFWYLDISMYKDIFKDKGQLGISINDIFYSNITHTNAEYANINYSLKNKWDSRSFNIFFRYNFGKKDFKAKNIQTSATTDDIKNRAN